MSLSWKTCLKAGITVFLVYLAIYYWSIASTLISKFVSSLSPILIGFSIAYVLNILMSFYERHYFPKLQDKKWVKNTRAIICMIMSLVTLFLFVTFIIRLIVPEFVSCVKFIIQSIPGLITDITNSNIVHKYVPEDIINSVLSIDWNNIINNGVRFLLSGVSTAATAVFSALSSMIGFLITLFLSIIFSVYFLLGKYKLFNQGNKLIHTYFPKNEKKVKFVFSIFNDCFHKFIVGQCLEAVILWALCNIGMLLFKFPYANMISAFIGFTALIPIAGAYIGALVGALMISTISPFEAIMFIIFIIILQQIEGNFIYPKVVGNSIGLPAIWVIVAITIGGTMMGIIGMIIGVPLLASIYRLISYDMQKRQKEKTDNDVSV